VEVPAAADRELGEMEMENVPVTTRLTGTVLLKPPLVPVITREYVPTGVDAVVAIVIVVEPEVVTVVGLKLAVAPVGSPLTLKLTVPVKPLDGVTVGV
jgi:hypothetical protein